MHKFMTLTLIAAALALPAHAADSQADIDADKGAIRKDNAAISDDNGDIAKDRAKKAAAKADGDYGKQAVDSVAIGADKAAKEEKLQEKSVDKKILTHHENDMDNVTGQ